MSNVDLTQELADMIVIQRGYQASSRVMTVTNSMLQDLYDSTRSG
jgi:flagellar hook protein FlgE